MPIESKCFVTMATTSHTSPETSIQFTYNHKRKNYLFTIEKCISWPLLYTSISNNISNNYKNNLKFNVLITESHKRTIMINYYSVCELLLYVLNETKNDNNSLVNNISIIDSGAIIGVGGVREISQNLK